MALIHLMTTSKYLQRDIDINIYKPNEIDKKAPLHLMILLHGYMGNYTNWLRYTRLEKYLEGKNIVVVMPSGENSWYLNGLFNDPYENFLNRELHKIIKETLNLVFKRENTSIVGLSMGGYGAIRSLLKYSHLYSKGASLSGVLDLGKHYQRIRENYLKGRAIFPEVMPHDFDLFNLLKANLDVDIYLSCGNSDGLLDDSIKFKEELDKKVIKHHLNLTPGDHNWEFWDREIKAVIKYFGI
ncbi:MAG: alpha/beta hydrolase-fold protein [Acholeplasmataceae bacterium]